MLALGAADTSGALRARPGASNHDSAVAVLRRMEEWQIHLARSLRTR